MDGSGRLRIPRTGAVDPKRTRRSSGATVWLRHSKLP